MERQSEALWPRRRRGRFGGLGPFGERERPARGDVDLLGLVELPPSPAYAGAGSRTFAWRMRPRSDWRTCGFFVAEYGVPRTSYYEILFDFF